ncbi:MAG: lyase family protein, partial [Gemmatimonadota bacterium]
MGGDQDGTSGGAGTPKGPATPDGTGSPEGKRALWGGRFESGMAPAMEPLNRSLDLDRRFWRHDIRGSRAWAAALADAGVLTNDERDALRAGLDAVGERLKGADFSAFADEDIHSLVERLLFEEVGEVAGKLHTARSRNDQVATDMRLWGMEATGGVAKDLRALCRALTALAERSLDVILP